MRTLAAADRRERILANPAAAGFVAQAPGTDAYAFHRNLAGYEASPLREAPGTAARLGAAKVWVKDESSRWGLPAFKMLGATWATVRAVAAWAEANGPVPGGIRSPLLPPGTPPIPSDLTLTCATDGNHGRAVARMARLLGIGARIYVPADLAPARVDAIRSEGATVIVHPGTYDNAVAHSAAAATDEPRTLVISDTSWSGYEDVPRWVIEGYSTIGIEADLQLADLNEPAADIVAVQIGVGALAAAVVGHWRQTAPHPRPLILGIEPTAAACLLHSMEAGEPVGVPGPHDSIMAGLNCGQPSPLAWPTVSGGIDLFLAVDDDRAREGMHLLAADGIVAGECGGAGIGGLIAWTERFGGSLAGKSVLVISTEGMTDPEAYHRIVGQPAPRNVATVSHLARWKGAPA